MHGAKRCSAGTAGNAGIYLHQGAVAISERPAGDIIQVNRAAHHAGDPMFPSRREQDPAGGLPPRCPPSRLTSSCVPPAGRREQGKAEGNQGFWECGRGSVSARGLVLTAE